MTARYRVQSCAYPSGQHLGFGVDDWSPDQNTARPGKFLVVRTAIRDYTRTEAQQVADWLNGYDQSLPNMLEDWKDPLLNASGRLSRLP